MRDQGWDIKERGHACQACQAPFADGQTYVSRLTFGEAGYERGDYCVGCWSKLEPSDRVVSLWKSVYEAPPPPAPEPLPRETAESLLRGLIARGGESHVNSMYILALMLERRRLLIEKETRTRPDGRPVRVYEHRKTGDTFIIVDPLLDLRQVEHVQQEVMAMLQHGLPPEPGTPADAGPEDHGRPPA
jgi:hypothetical protein